MRLYYPDTLSPEQNVYEKERWHYERAKRKGLTVSPPHPAVEPVRPPHVPPWTIGLDLDTGEWVTLSPDDRTVLTHGIGVSGSGKTTILENLYIADALAGMGAICIDPHGDLTDHLLWRIIKDTDRKSDVILLDADDFEYPFALPLYRKVDPRDHEKFQRAVEQSVHVYKALYGAEGAITDSWGPHLEDLATVVGHTFVEAGLTLADVPVFLSDDIVRRAIVSGLTQQDIRRFWETEYPPGDTARGREEQRRFRSSFINKVRALTLNRTVKNITSATAPKLNFRRFVEDKKLVLIRLPRPRIGKMAVSLLGSTVLGEILNAGFTRGELPLSNRHLVTVYVDEVELMQTPDLHEMAEQIRKFGISLVQFHQSLSQLSEENKAAALGAPSFIAGRTSSLDVSAVVKRYDNTPQPGKPKYEPVWVESQRYHGKFEQLRAYYGSGRNEESNGVFRQVPGDDLSTAEMRDRLENKLVKWPFHEFLAVLQSGTESRQVRFHGLASPCSGDMPADVRAEIEKIRERCRREYCIRREEVEGAVTQPRSTNQPAAQMAATRRSVPL